MTVAEKKRQRAKLRRQREEVEDKAIEKAVEQDALERERQRLKNEEDRLEDRTPETQEILDKIEKRLAEIDDELAANHRQIASVREREDALERAGERLTRRIKKLTRQIRNMIRPQVTDLHMPFASGGCTPHNIVGSIGHYTAGPLARTDEEAVRMWWGVRSQHIGQGWSNIGYHIGLGPEGGVYLLRPMGCVGAHTLGKNTGYVGLSVHGTTGHTWTRAQKRALRYAVRKWNLKPVSVHNDWNVTACPGAFEAGYKSVN